MSKEERCQRFSSEVRCINDKMDHLLSNDIDTILITPLNTQMNAHINIWVKKDSLRLKYECFKCNNKNDHTYKLPFEHWMHNEKFDGHEVTDLHSLIKTLILEVHSNKTIDKERLLIFLLALQSVSNWNLTYDTDYIPVEKEE